MDRAMELGLWEHADRVSRTAGRIARLNAGLTERIARLRLIQQTPEAALALIDACPGRPASLRLLRNICLLRAGRHSDAHMDLHSWAVRASCPLAARLLLGTLERKIGDVSAAIAALTRNLNQMDDPRTLAILTALCATTDRPEQARTWADRLRSACAQTDAAPGVDLMLRSLGLPGIDAADEPSEHLVQTLATELLANEDVIPSLAAAQQLQPDIRSARLLAAALEQSLDDLETPAVGFEALSRLCEILDDHEAAIDWVRRGIELCPMSAGLARLSRELCGESNSGETDAADLERAA
jgi:tetratricopeptide (TPR) repeat protein